jgi:hypothetical protein
MEHTKHIWRAVLLLLLLGLSAVAGRHFLIPPSFGTQGFYRYDSLAEYMAKPVIHGPANACRECHQPIVESEIKGKHASQSCEGCHAPLSVHVADNKKIADMPSKGSNEWCANCHGKLRARPQTFPQIDVTEHLVKNGVISAGDPIPKNACTTCHDVHSPGTS